MSRRLNGVTPPVGYPPGMSSAGNPDPDEQLRLARLELMKVYADQERVVEELQVTKRQRSKLRKESIALSSALAGLLTTQYWAGRSAKSGWFGRGSAGQSPDQSEAELVRQVEGSDLFDGGWYLRRHLDVFTELVHPALHYVREGGAAGLNPGPRFNTKRYLAGNEAARTSPLPPLVYYLRHGSPQDLATGARGRSKTNTKSLDVHL